jgi:CDGSH-type Zn-finger protein
MPDTPESPKNEQKIIIMPNGSYHIHGEIPLVHKTQVVSEYGEPLTWKKDRDYSAHNIEGRDFYALCRCGQSQNKPFCDGTHRKVGFDGAETADTGSSETRSHMLTRGTHIAVYKDTSLCMQAGFCGFADAGMSMLLADTQDTKIRALVTAMVERCPSGALTYRIEEGEEKIEPDLPVQIAVTTEITSEGPIEGPLWVTGNISIERSDGQPLETRNRVTLCNCGSSCNKPLCDGTHRTLQEGALRQQRLKKG